MLPFSYQTYFDLIRLFFPGMSVLVSLLRRCLTGVHGTYTEKLVEGILFCLQSAIKENERNHRKLLLVGLDVLMDLEEGICPVGYETDKNIILAVKSENVRNISKFLVELIGEFNFVVCKHCEKKQSIKGLNCIFCGYRLPVENTSMAILSPERRSKILANVGKSKSAPLSNSLPLSLPLSPGPPLKALKVQKKKENYPGNIQFSSTVPLPLPVTPILPGVLGVKKPHDLPQVRHDVDIDDTMYAIFMYCS